MTREEHVAQSKRRALEYLERGDLVNAVASMGSDLCSRDDTRANPYIMMVGMRAATERDAAGVRRWIDGFN